MQDYPLSDLKILEIPGPDMPVAASYCTKLLADFGAEVVRVDSPSVSTSVFAQSQFFYLNTNKKSVTLDLCSEAGVEILDRLAAHANVVVESAGPCKLDCDSFCAAHPSIILTSISWFGSDGPYAGYQGSDIVAQALAGVMSFTGVPEREPLKIAGPQAEYQAGINAAVATMVALQFQGETGLGQYIDVSAMEVLASILEGALLSHAYDGTTRHRDGARHPTVYPSTILPCRDGFVHVDASTDWETFARFTGIEKLLSFDPQALRESADEIDQLLLPWLAEYTREEIFNKAQDWRLPFAMVMGISGLQDDSQLQARCYFERIDHPAAGALICPGAPFKMSHAERKTGRPPLLAEHNQEIPMDLSDRLSSEPDCRISQGKEMLPLEGLRVLDLSQVYAGPYCARILADMGAEVIRVESAVRSGRGGLTAQPGAVYPDGDPSVRPYNRSAYYNELHRNKLAISLDLSKERGRELFTRLVETTDVLIENFSPRVMTNFGLEYPVLHGTNPRLVMVSISAYGQTGPYRDFVSFGRGIEAMSGLSQLTAYEDGPPLGPGIAYADANAGLHAAFAVLMALRVRHRTGEGQHIDLSLRESLISLLGQQVVDYSMKNRVPRAMGNQDDSVLHQGCYRCRGEDQWLAVSVHTEDELGRLTNIMCGSGKTDGLHRLIEGWAIRRDAGEAMHTLQDRGIRAAKICTPQDLMGDPHLAARGFFEYVTHPEAGTYPHCGMPWKMSLTPGEIRRPAPCFAQHNDYVFGELLALSSQEISQLEEDGVIPRIPLR